MRCSTGEKKMLKSMQKQYGKKKGTQIFFATKNTDEKTSKKYDDRWKMGW